MTLLKEEPELIIPKDAMVKIGGEIRGPKPYKPNQYRMAVDVLCGMNYREAGLKHGTGTKQNTQYVFRLTVVKYIFPTMKDQIIKNNYDINYLRELWRDYLK